MFWRLHHLLFLSKHTFLDPLKVCKKTVPLKKLCLQNCQKFWLPIWGRFLSVLEHTIQTVGFVAAVKRARNSRMCHFDG